MKSKANQLSLQSKMSQFSVSRPAGISRTSGLTAAASSGFWDILTVLFLRKLSVKVVCSLRPVLTTRYVRLFPADELTLASLAWHDRRRLLIIITVGQLCPHGFMLTRCPRQRHRLVPLEETAAPPQRGRLSSDPFANFR